jgi:hypothetical protein
LEVDVFCLQEGVSKSTFYRWIDRLKDGIPESMESEKAAREKTESGEAAFVPISLKASPVEIELPNGGIVRLPLGVGQAVLVEVIRAVGALQQAVAAEQRAAQAEKQVTELNRVLNETAASYGELQQQHAATLDELAWFKRWAFGRRRERVTEGHGQGHLFDLEPPANDSPVAVVHPPETETHAEPDSKVPGDRRRSKRQSIGIGCSKRPQP